MKRNITQTLFPSSCILAPSLISKSLISLKSVACPFLRTIWGIFMWAAQCFVGRHNEEGALQMTLSNLASRCTGLSFTHRASWNHDPPLTGKRNFSHGATKDHKYGLNVNACFCFQWQRNYFMFCTYVMHLLHMRILTKVETWDIWVRQWITHRENQSLKILCDICHALFFKEVWKLWINLGTLTTVSRELQ